jgi:hypothetical protein
LMHAKHPVFHFPITPDIAAPRPLRRALPCPAF